VAFIDFSGAPGDLVDKILLGRSPPIFRSRRKNNKLSVVSIIVANMMPSPVLAGSRRVGSRESCFRMTSSSDSIAAKSVRPQIPFRAQDWVGN
jgi:hypothetical protein